MLPKRSSIVLFVVVGVIFYWVLVYFGFGDKAGTVLIGIALYEFLVRLVLGIWRRLRVGVFRAFRRLTGSFIRDNLL